MQHSTRLPSTFIGSKNLMRMALGLLLVSWVATAQAFGLLNLPGVYIPQMYYKIGAVYSRAIVLSPGGHPVYVEYNVSGKEAAEIGEAVGSLESARVMPAASYRALLQRLSDARERYPDSQVMKAADYRSKTFKTVTGETISKPQLASNSLTVLVRADQQLYSTDGKDLLLLELPIKSDVRPSGSSQSLLLSEEGDILHQTANTIGYRVGFYGKDGKVADSTSARERGSDIYGPLAGVPVTLGTGNGGAVTDKEGKYNMFYFLPPCPGFTFEYTTNAYLELNYKRFNPRGSSYMPYYMTRQDWDFCMGLSALSWLVMGIEASVSTPMKPNFDFPVDLMVLDGSATMKGAKLGAKTEYSSETGKRDHYLQDKYDFDGDENPDWVVPGKKVTKEIEGESREVFVKTSVEEAELQGIYLSSRYESVPANTEETGPDFTRLIDTAPDFKDRGLLKSVSEEDLRDTDIYVFRESNGQLVAERRGLHESELYKNYSGVDGKEGSFRYTIHLRGSKEGQFAAVGRYQGDENFAKWQSAGGFKEEFQKRNANHLKAGEMVRIIAINRPTGYIGSVQVQLQSASEATNGYLLDFARQRIEMAPPNLKVWAERKSKIEQGMTKGEEKRQLIGNEGAGLGSDISIAIYSDWRDTDGGPLPEELADYGYTGRLAKIVAANQLAPVGANNLSQFKIKPGQQVQVIQLPEKVLAKQHLYLQVAGQPDNRNPDFSSDGSASGILKHRPTHYVPVLVPLHDEEASELARQAYRKADKEYPELDLKKPEPMYAWQYRSELQFSLYELNVEEVRKVDQDGRETDIYKQERPIVTASDKFLEFIYGLVSSEFGELPAWGHEGSKEIVLAVGENEVKATLGRDQSIRLDNLDHLSSLAEEDYLSMRLYANGDVGNALWEFAFMPFSVELVDDSEWVSEDVLYVNADTPTVDLASILHGYSRLEEKNRWSERVLWTVEGDGAVSPASVTVPGSGVTLATANLKPRAGNVIKVIATLSSDQTAKAKSFEIEVLPGKPATVELSQQGFAYVQKHGETIVEAKVKDRNGNIVADGTSISFKVKGNAFISKYQSHTIDGVAKATIKGGNTSGSYPVAVEVGGIKKNLPITIRPLLVEFVDLPITLEGGQSYKAKVRVSGGVGRPDGIFIDIGVNKGILQREIFKTNSDGEIPFEIHTPRAGGEIRLSAKADINNPSTRSVSVSPLLLSSKFANGFLVGGLAGKERDSYAAYDGTVKNIVYTAGDVLQLQGQAHEQWNASFDDVHLVNRKVLYLNRFFTLADDESRLYKATYTNVVRQHDAPAVGLYAVHFEGVNSHWYLPYEDILDVSSPAYNFWLNPSAAGQVFTVGNGSVKLEILSSGVVQAELLTSAGKLRLEVPRVAFNSWHKVALGLNEGRFYLAVNDNYVSQALPQGHVSMSEGGEKWLQLGGGFVGNISGFRVYDRDTEPVLRLSQASGVYDESGRANVAVRVSDGYPAEDSAITATIGLISSAGNTSINVLGKSTFDLYAQGLGDVSGRSSVSALDVSEELNIAEMFPSLDQPMASLVSKYVSSEEGGPLQVVLSSFAWLRMRAEMEDLHSSVKVFQNYYASYKAEPLLNFAAQYLAEAIAQAESGNNRTLNTYVTGMVVWAELIDASPMAAETAAKAIQNHADYWTWLRFLSLPRNGWAGPITPIPKPKNTCDRVTPTVNAGTPYAFSMTPCRATGVEMADFINAWTIDDPVMRAEPDTITDNMRFIMAAANDGEFEFTKTIFGESGSEGISSNFSLIPKAYANPIVMKLLQIVFKSAVRTAGASGPANMVNFLKDQTTSRFKAREMLFAIAYLESRSPDSPMACQGCVHLSEEVAENYRGNFLKWITGLALAEKGNIPDEQILRRQCTLTNHAHGAALEIVAMAAYHAMYEFGGEAGKKFRILAADPQGKAAPMVGLFESEHAGRIEYLKVQRKPDLIMAGKAAGQRYWVELKSWRYNKNYFNEKKDELSHVGFPLWNGISTSTNIKHTAAAHRQHFIDYVASKDRLSDYWDESEYSALKPAEHISWMQVWEEETRWYKPLKKKGAATAPKAIPVNTAASWIDMKGRPFPVMNQQFKALQSYLTSAPSKMRGDVFERSVGYSIGSHAEKYQKRNVGQLSTATVAPFTLKSMMARELSGDAAVKAVYDRLDASLGLSDLKQFLGQGDLTEEQIAQLRKKVEDEIGKNLKALKEIQDAVEEVQPDFINEGEDWAQEYVNGWVGDATQEFINGVELPEVIFSDYCEIP